MRPALGEPPVVGQAAPPATDWARFGPSSEPGRLLALGAAVGLATMVVTSSGDALAAGVLLGLVAADLRAGATGVLVAVSVAGRWGSTSLVALAGGQAVVGAAGWSGSSAMALSSWAAAIAVLSACPRHPPSDPDGRPSQRRSGQRPSSPATPGSRQPGASVPGALATGVFAAALVAGPAVGSDTASAVALRVVASVLGIAAAVVVARLVPLPAARVLGLIAAASAAAIALLA